MELWNIFSKEEGIEKENLKKIIDKRLSNDIPQQTKIIENETIEQKKKMTINCLPN